MDGARLLSRKISSAGICMYVCSSSIYYIHIVKQIVDT